MKEDSKRRRRARRLLTVEEKLAVVNSFERARHDPRTRLVARVHEIATQYGVSNSHVYHLYQHREAIRNCFAMLAAGQAMEQDEAPKCKPPARRRKRKPRRLSLLTLLNIVEQVERHIASRKHRTFKLIRRRFRVSIADIMWVYEKRTEIRKEVVRLAEEACALCPLTIRKGGETAIFSSSSPSSSSASSAFSSTTYGVAQMPVVEQTESRLTDTSVTFLNFPNNQYGQVLCM